MNKQGLTIVTMLGWLGGGSHVLAQTAPTDAAAPVRAATSPSARSAAPPPPAAPRPPAELDGLFRSYLGTWTCDTTYPAGSAGQGSPETKLKATIGFRKDLGGMWYRADYDARRTRTTPPFRGVFYLGYDPAMKAALLAGVDSMGSTSMAIAPAAAGDTVIFTGEGFVMGQKVKTRETLFRKGPREMEHRYEMDTGSGLQVMVVDVCRRGGGAAPAASPSTTPAATPAAAPPPGP